MASNYVVKREEKNILLQGAWKAIPPLHKEKPPPISYWCPRSRIVIHFFHVPLFAGDHFQKRKQSDSMIYLLSPIERSRSLQIWPTLTDHSECLAPTSCSQWYIVLYTFIQFICPSKKITKRSIWSLIQSIASQFPWSLR